MKDTVKKIRPLAWLFCPTCGKTNFLFRQRLGNYCCRICGTVFVADKKTHSVKLVELPSALSYRGRVHKDKRKVL